MNAASAIRPPAGSRLVEVAPVVSGTQTYTCTGGIFTGSSVPEAQLRGFRGPIHHYKGPNWTAKDGSTITGAKKAENPRPGTIAELLLDVAAHSGPTGAFSKVTHIQRLLTSGGTAPTGACTDGATKAVKYGAVYVFWAAPAA